MNDELSYDERVAIRLYKRISKRLPRYWTLSGYWVTNFDGNTYDELVVYLKDLKRYLDVLTKSTKYRQQHYEIFIKGKRIEDSGHRTWREAMNTITKDADAKYRYWSDVEDLEFSKFVPASPIPDISIINVDLDDLDDENIPEDISIVEPPQLSIREKNRRKKLRYKLKKKKAVEEERLLNEVSMLMSEDPFNIKKNNEPIDLSEVISEYKKSGECIIDPFYIFKDSILIKGSFKQKKQMVDMLMDAVNREGDVQFQSIILYYLMIKDRSIKKIMIDNIHCIFYSQQGNSCIQGCSLWLLSPFNRGVFNANLRKMIYDIQAVPLYNRRCIVMLFIINEIFNKWEIERIEKYRRYLKHLVKDIDTINQEVINIKNKTSYHESTRYKNTVNIVLDSINNVYLLIDCYFDLPYDEYILMFNKLGSEQNRYERFIHNVISDKYPNK